MPLKKLSTIVLAVIACVMLSTSAFAQAQPPRDGRLLITVVDATNSILPGAIVTVVGVENATKATAIPPVKASEVGLATFERLRPGRYSIQGEFPGFDLGLMRDVRVRSGDNKHILILPLRKMEDSVTVGRDRQEAAADRTLSFGTVLTREQIEALSEDPDELKRQLQDMAGLGSVIRVDSFEGQQLPPKAQIKMVRISRDQFAAENHGAGGLHIDIITQPGIGPLRASARLGFYDSSMDGKHPLVQQKGPAQSRNWGGNLGGTLLKDRSSFSLNFSGNTSYSTPVLNAATPSGTRIENLNLRQPSDAVFVSGLWDYAITKDQTLRVGFNSNRFTSENQGVGVYDLIERAYSSENNVFSMRVQEAGPLGRRFFTNTRFSLNISNSDTTSTLEAPTIVVNDAFTSGGAQRAGGRRTRAFSLGSDLDYVRGKHSVRIGVLLDGGSYRSDDASNYLGTYTFESLEAFEAGRPRSYTRRIGDPTISYFHLQSGIYIQDDIKLRKNLTITPGLRYEAQTRLDDYDNFAPRFGITWAPFKNGKTTLRTSWGIFYDWLTTNTIEQTLRVDGFRQQELNIINPSYPDPGLEGVIPPTNRYLLDDDMYMGRNTRVSAGLQQAVTSKFSVGATFSDIRGDGILRGRNLNAPVNGVRPDPAFANVIQTVSDARLRTRSVSTNAGLSFFTPTPNNTRFFDWKRNLGLYGNYTWSRARNNSDGTFSLPATGSLDAEWGPSNGDVRHRGNISISTGLIKNFNGSIDFSMSSAPPITIRTGVDDNGDLVFNDRPAGVGRNTERTTGQWQSFAFFSYWIGLGKRQVASGGPMGGIMIREGAGPVTVSTMAAQALPRYRLSFNVQISNLTNHANYTGYSGVMTSPFFLKPTGASGVRRINFGMSLSF
ncbi:MAG TPA: TonB-dependent receptor [Vicinamibacterales bacterium]|nr:TonB-dependent receptor [Vicinamibacterales bacterium]